MKLKNSTYKKVASLVMSVFLLAPVLIVSFYMLLHHNTTDTSHKHDVTMFCNHSIQLSEFSDFTFTFYDVTIHKISYQLTNFIFKSIDSNSFENSYFTFLLGNKKGRSPPELS